MASSAGNVSALASLAATQTSQSGEADNAKCCCCLARFWDCVHRDVIEPDDVIEIEASIAGYVGVYPEGDRRADILEAAEVG